MNWNEVTVAQAAAFLDAEEPGWAKRINLETFSIDSHFRCILGQLYGSYSEGADKFGIDGEGNPFNNGYNARPQAWINEVKQRQAVTS